MRHSHSRARSNGGGEAKAARSVFFRGEWAWLGIDAPIPCLMSADFEPDAAICARSVTDGLQARVRHFFADIEAPSAKLDTPAYGHFAALGFRPTAPRSWTLSFINV